MQTAPRTHRSTRALWRLATALIVLGACGEGTTEPIAPLDSLPRVLTAAESNVAGASNAFGFDLLRELSRAAAGNENVIVSPLSVSLALGMALNGAQNETFAAMRQALRLPEQSLDDLNPAYRSLIELLAGLDPNTRFDIANSIWYREGLPVYPEFLDRGRDYFFAEVSPLDFASPSAVGVINDWVSEQTNGKIPTILDQIDLDEVMFLINAIYFNGTWTVAFDPRDTRDDTFRLADGSTVPVRMMHLRDSLQYATGPGFEALDLRYGRGAFTMTILLPHEGGDLDAIVEALGAESWSGATAAFAEREVDLAFPRLRLEWSKSLVDALTALGMEIAFDRNRADFYGIADVAPERLFISRVDHKTFLEVDEAGTVAAAVTNVGVGVTCACGPVSFRVDRPFLLAIRERFSGTILFLGKVTDPAA